MMLGIFAGLSAGALWGLMFVGPRAVEPFTTLDLTVGRYTVFGAISLLLMLHPRFRPRRITRGLMAAALILGVTGYIGYFFSVSYAVQLAGAAIPPLIIGAVPVLLAIIGNWGEKGLPWRLLAVPLTLIALGIGLVNVSALLGAEQAGSARSVALGSLCAVAALAIWLVYAIINARAMRGPNAVGSLPWTSLQGVGAGVGVLFLLPFLNVDGASFMSASTLATPEGLRFLGWSLFLGSASSWLAGWCWIEASRLLPLALTAQLMVAETAFALLFGFIYEGRWPTLPEASGILLQLIGVVTGVALFTTRRKAAFEAGLNKAAASG